MNGDLIFSLLGDGLFAAVAAIGFAVISNPPRKTIFVSALLAAIGHALRYYLINVLGMSISLASLLAAFAIGLLSMVAARRIRCPAEVFSFPSLLPMIPGMYAYKTVLAFIRLMGPDRGDSQELIVDIFKNGLTTFFVMSALVVGVLLPLFMFPKLANSMTRFFRPKVRGNN